MGYFSRGEQAVVLLLVAALLVGCGVLSWQALARPGAALPAGPAGGSRAGPEPPTSGGGGSGTPGEAAPQPLTVHVCGAVARPGVYRLPPGSRVADALKAAGGAAPGAALDELNLAALVRDGQKVEVPAAAGRRPSGGSGGGTGGVGSTPRPAGPSPDNPLDLNSAGAKALDALPGIGPVLAARVVAYREEHGPFASVEDLLRVVGIGPRTLEEIRPLVRVD